MLVRLVEVTVRSGLESDLKKVYQSRIIPSMEQTDGCLFAGLLQSLEHADEFCSLTLWGSEEDARTYVQSGRFETNLNRARPYLESSSEWKIQLSRNDTLEYAPVRSEPVIKSYPVEESAKPPPEHVRGTHGYLRVLSLKLKPDEEEEFSTIYWQEIQPALENVPGCRYAFLIDNVEGGREMLSFTIWDDLESVAQYEKGGMFKQLLQKVEHTLSELYQWKMALGGTSTSTTVTSEDIGISKFTLVAGKRFE